MKRLALAFVSLFVAGGAFAETPFQLAVPNANLPSDPNVRGLRLSFLNGQNQSTRGVDFGVLSYSETSRAAGAAFIAGVHNAKSSARGAFFSLVNYHQSSDTGMNGAFVNVLSDTRRAFNVGFVTYVEGPTLVDLGGINISRSSSVQVGFFNMTSRLSSFQFGFLNMADNGFLPIFPVFNFPVR